jgi:hypothetical protein
MMRRWVYLTILVSLLGLTLFWAVDVPFKASSIYGIAEPYLFNMSRWETQHLLSKTKDKLKDLVYSYDKDDIELVKKYFDLAGQVGYLDFQLEQEKANDGEASQLKQIQAELSPKQKQLNGWKSKVEAIIEKQVTQVLRDEGLARGRLLLPPVAFDLDNLPNVLIVSPREKIYIVKQVTLDPNLSLAKIEYIENRIEQELGLSAEIEGLGGLATYPSLIPQTDSLGDALSTVAHEWMHQYFFFQPLGHNYDASYEMTTINETAADIAGNEIGARLLALYGLTPPQSEPPANPPAFNFAKEMRRIRLTVDQYLAQGQVKEAEAFMEESRQYLADHGYYIRKLNQAYFAFHGSYADTPTSTNPIGAELQTLRANSSSLGSFIKQVAKISSYQEFKKLGTTDTVIPR